MLYPLKLTSEELRLLAAKIGDDLESLSILDYPEEEKIIVGIASKVADLLEESLK